MSERSTDAQDVFIYSGPGVAERSILETPLSVDSIALEFGYKSKIITSSAFDDPEWRSKTAALIMPGGADVPYHKSLRGKYNRVIREYVEGGGCYIGFCGGAYYGSAFVEFDKGGDLEVIGERELKFFEGVARGPAYGKGTFFYHNDNGARVTELLWCDPSQSSKFESPPPLYVYYNGGCIFVEPEQHSNVTVLARYLDLPNHPAAIIECRIGKGKAILSGVHPEYSLESMPLKSEQGESIRNEIMANKEGRMWVLREIFKRVF